MRGIRKPVRIIFLFVFLAALPWPGFNTQAPAQKKAFRGIAGIPFPEPPLQYGQPITRRAKIVQGNGGRFSHNDPRSRYCWDYEVPISSPVVAARAGTVLFVRCDSNIGGAPRSRFLNEGNIIIIDHLDGTCGNYSHLQKNSALVQPGEYVIQGERIGSSGDTGYAQAPHLHFGVTRVLDGISLSVSFSDFKKNQGVPREGDFVEPARSPAIPQIILTEYKATLRACSSAENLGAVDLAWSFADKPSIPRRYLDSFYGRVLEARKTLLREKVVERLTAFTCAGEDSLNDLPVALRFVDVLGSARDGEIKARVCALKKKLDRDGSHDVKSWKAERRAIRYHTAGLRMESHGKISEACDCYVAAVQHSRGPFDERARRNLRRFIHTYKADFMMALARLVKEMEKAETRHRSRIAADVPESWKNCRTLLDAWLTYFPGEKPSARTALDTAQSHYRKLSQNRSR